MAAQQRTAKKPKSRKQNSHSITEREKKPASPVAILQRVTAKPESARPSDIRILQQAYGNRVTQSILANPAFVVQRELMGPMVFHQQSGTKAKKKGKFQKIANGLGQYRVAKHKGDKLRQFKILQTLESDIRHWLNTVGKSKGVGRFFRKGAKRRHQKKINTLNNLLGQVAQEKQQLINSNLVEIGENIPEAMDTFTGDAEAMETAILQILEASMKGQKPEAIYNRLLAAYNILVAKAQELLTQKQNRQPVDENAGEIVGHSWLRIMHIVFNFLRIFGEEGLNISPQLHVKGADPKKLYEYALLTDAYKEKSAKEVQFDMDQAMKAKLTKEKITVHDWMSTPEGLDFREAQSFLANPALKQLYDMYVDGQIGDLNNLVQYREQFLDLNQKLTQVKVAMAMEAVPGFQRGADLKLRTFYEAEPEESHN